MSNTKRKPNLPDIGKFGAAMIDMITNEKPIEKIADNSNLIEKSENLETKETIVNSPTVDIEDETIEQSNGEVNFQMDEKSLRAILAIEPKKEDLKVTFSTKITDLQFKRLRRICDIFEINQGNLVGNLIDKLYSDNEKLIIKLYNKNQKL